MDMCTETVQTKNKKTKDETGFDEPAPKAQQQVVVMGRIITNSHPPRRTGCYHCLYLVLLIFRK